MLVVNGYHQPEKVAENSECLSGLLQVFPDRVYTRCKRECKENKSRTTACSHTKTLTTLTFWLLDVPSTLRLHRL